MLARTVLNEALEFDDMLSTLGPDPWLTDGATLEARFATLDQVASGLQVSVTLVTSLAIAAIVPRGAAMVVAPMASGWPVAHPCPQREPWLQQVRRRPLLATQPLVRR